MHILRGAAAAIVALTVGLAAQAQVNLEAARTEVFAAERFFARSMAERDLSAFARHIAADAVFFGNAAVQRGRDAVLAAWKPFFDSAQAPFSREPDQVEVLASGDLALSTGPVRSAAGQVIACFNSSWRRESDDGRWRVVFDKGSPPDPPAK